MNVTTVARLRILALVVVVAGVSIVLYWRSQSLDLKDDYLDLSKVEPTGSPSASPIISPESSAASPSVYQTPIETPAQESVSPAVDSAPRETYVGKLNLLIPVMGIKPEQLLDTFADARSEGRVHDAIDIPAPAGTPVVAAIEGEVIKLFQSERGGNTIYQLSPDKKLVFYYAHLQGYADGLVPGKYVRQGETIAYVGDTGNAGAGNNHLHFAIMVVADPKRYWEGTNINPYSLLRR